MILLLCLVDFACFLILSHKAAFSQKMWFHCCLQCFYLSRPVNPGYYLKQIHENNNGDNLTVGKGRDSRFFLRYSFRLFREFYFLQ